MHTTRHYLCTYTPSGLGIAQPLTPRELARVATRLLNGGASDAATYAAMEANRQMLAGTWASTNGKLFSALYAAPKAADQADLF